MVTTAVVIEHEFDTETLNVLQELRQMRIESAKRMLEDLDESGAQIRAHAVVEFGEDGAPRFTKSELRSHLEAQIEEMHRRLDRPEVVYAEEISYYVDLLSD